MDAERTRKLAGGAVPTPIEVAELCRIAAAAREYVEARELAQSLWPGGAVERESAREKYDALVAAVEGK